MNVSSVFADRVGPSTDYSGSKRAIRGLTRTVAKEYGTQGIRINELQPGVINTEIPQADPEGTQEVDDRGIPLKRIGTGREGAAAIALLLFDDASDINGVHLAVDGGFFA
ncbi:SDR family NAD(P)-dependent oxidoreductase [Paenibacillus sp. NPDC057934]|uniref:SDR family NAD(P)-dependent oxidoreductase n=1 Tax=Paenibacillus sp. NPDC057934 TaxID=3346282 RepID=UPI0036D895D2